MARTERTNYMASGSIDVTRGDMVRRDDDNVGEIKVGLYDIDNAIKYYFDNVIQPKVDIDGKGSYVAVPVMYASPERWKAMQQDGFIRDKKGKVQFPVIAYKRTNMEKVRNMSRNLDANFPNLFQTVEKKYTQRNAYDKFSILTGVNPQQEYYNVVVPDYITVTYECAVWTDYIEDMNKIIEAINYAEGSYWGDLSTFKFYAQIDSYTQAQSVEAGQDRLIKCDFTLIIKGYIVSDALQAKAKIASQKSYPRCRVKVDFNVVERIVNTGDPLVPISNILNNNTGEDTPVNNRGRLVGNIDSGDLQLNITAQGGSGVSTTTLLYLENVTSAVATAALTTTNTATFEDKSIATPPSTSGLPTQTKEDFRFFINGQYIPDSYITSFTESGINIVLTVDTASLGYDLKPTHTIAAFGRFGA